MLPNGGWDLVRQIAFMFVAYWSYRTVRGAVDDPAGAAVAFAHTRDLISVEQALNLFVEPSIQAWAEGKPLILDISSWFYINAQSTITLGTLTFIYLAHNRSFYFVRNMFAVSWALALVGYGLYPVAPPRMFPEWGFADSVSTFLHVSHRDSVSRLFNPYAAVPSMHVCFALMVGVPLSRLCKHRPVRLFWTIYPLLVVFVIVSTGNHFLTDAFLGACTAGVGALVARQLGRLRPEAWTFTGTTPPAPAPAAPAAPVPAVA